MKPIICIAGPTASGKSAWAIEIAKKYGGEIINADAMQVYRDLQILSARPTPSEMQGIPHHLFGHVAGDVRYSTGQWVREVQPIILDCLARDVMPILAGGTGLYFKALIDGLAEVPHISERVRKNIQQILDEYGVAYLRSEAEHTDPIATARVLGNDPQRLTRILSVYEETGRTLTDWQSNTRPIIPEIFCRCGVLMPERAALYERINARFANMIDNGGLAEAKAVFAKGYDPTLPIMKAIGLQQLGPYIEGAATLKESIKMASRDTRRLAKRQFTWFRGQGKNWVKVTNIAEKVAFEENIYPKTH